tara:strand:- start:274 stop:771 length:498 start_codon:yes stop_codon:yes gene_type:complete
MEDPRLISVNEKLNKYVALIRAKNPKMLERDILQQAATLAMEEQKKFEASANLDVNDVSITDRFGDGTKISTSKDGSLIVRVDHAWQQSKGSKISSDGFFKEGHATVTMPKEIDITTPEGDKEAGKFVDELKTAKKRGDKMQAAAEHQAWENRKVQVTVDKKEDL